MAGFPELFRAALDSAELCEVGSDEKVVIYTDSQTEPVIAEAWYSACVVRGCDPTLVRVMARAPQTGPPPSAVAAMIEADLVFDIPSMDWSYAPSAREVLESGTRMLDILLRARSVVERAPSMDVAWRADVAEGLLRNVREIRVTSSEGTDLRATLSEERPLDIGRGYIRREPGAWDTYGTSLIAVAPIEESVDGNIYFNGPLILEPLQPFSVEKPVHVEVERGRIVQIDTSHKDGQVLKRWFERFDDPNAYLFSHIGWGWDPTAELTSDEMTAWESLYGAVLVAFGSNTAPHLGGVVESAAHMDGTILTPSLWLDGHQIIKDGEFTDESGLRERG